MSSKKQQRTNNKKRPHSTTQKSDAKSDQSTKSQKHDRGNGDNKGKRQMNQIPKNTWSINWLKQWFKNLNSLDKFTLVIAIFTAILAFATSFQVWAFIQSERPIVGVTDIRLGKELNSNEFARIIIEIKK